MHAIPNFLTRNTIGDHMILLGISDGHNATATIIRNGAVLACASEERFTRTKNDVGYPKKAIDSVLEMAGISCEEIDFVLSSSIAPSQHLNAP